MRLALQAPPSGVEVTVQLVYNLIKRHGALKRLAHRRLTGLFLHFLALGLPCLEGYPCTTPSNSLAGIDDGETPTMEGDPYDIEQADPALSNAMVRTQSLVFLSLLVL
jgi:hypothetical protein